MLRNCWNRRAWKTTRQHLLPSTPMASFKALRGPSSLIPQNTAASPYLTVMRRNLSYSVQQDCLHMHDPHECHLTMLKMILWYVRGTTSLVLHLRASSSFTLTAYTDADWAGCPDTRCSTSSYCAFLGKSLVSWSSKRQAKVSRSSAEAEYRVVANAASECAWLRQLLGELHCDISRATMAYCDNVSAMYMSSNPIHHRWTKHIEIDIHFVREHVTIGELRVLHVPSAQQFADVRTKGMPPSHSPCFSSVSALSASTCNCNTPIL
jgi:hypothetical protein